MAAPKRAVLHPDGDLILVCGDPSGEIQVSPRWLCQFSSVFKAMLQRGFKEAQELSTSHVEPYRLNLPFDDHDAMLMICKIIYHQPPDASSALTSQSMEQLLVHSDKYDLLPVCKEVIRLHFSVVMPMLNGHCAVESMQDRFILLATVCTAAAKIDDGEVFAMASRKLSLFDPDIINRVIQSVVGEQDDNTKLSNKFHAAILTLHITNKNIIHEQVIESKDRLVPSLSDCVKILESQARTAMSQKPVQWSSSDFRHIYSLRTADIHDFIILQRFCWMLDHFYIGPFASLNKEIVSRLERLQTEYFELQASTRHATKITFPTKVPIDWTKFLQRELEDTEKSYKGLCLDCFMEREHKCEDKA